MKIETIKLVDIKPASYNPRQISQDAYNALKASLTRFGLVEPLVLNKQTGNLIGGHQRLKILREQGVNEIEVVVLDLSEIEEKALNITLNNQKIMGEFNEDLETLLGELSDDFEGFEDVGLDLLLEDSSKKSNIDVSDFDESDEQKERVVNMTCPNCGFTWHKE